LAAVKIEVKMLERGLVERLGSSRDIMLYGYLCYFGIQYSKGRSQSSSFMEKPKEDKTDMSMISSFDSVVAVYVLLPCELSKPNSMLKQSM
jgi:hypothetical protein